MGEPSDKYRNVNHHHELTDRHEIIHIDGQDIVANVEAVELLTALNNIGLRTRTHHVSDEHSHAFVSIMMDNHVSVEIRTAYERDADRTRYNGKTEMVIAWCPLKPKSGHESGG